MPQAIDMEESVCGALLVESAAFREVEDILTPEDFYNPVHKTLFQAVCSLAEEGKPIDLFTVVDRLRLTGELESVGGATHLAGLSQKMTSAAHIDYHARIIKQKSVARKIICLASEIQRRAFDETEDIADVMEELEKRLTEINANSSGFESVDMPAVLHEAVEMARQTQKDRQEGKLTAIPTGLHALNDAFAGGWRAPDLIIIGARPSMGKTQHALSFAKAASKAGINVMFASIEMSAVQLVNRYLLEDDRISGYNLRTGQMSIEEWQAVDEQKARLSDMSLHIADDHHIRQLSNIKSEARRLHRKGNLKLLVIDYLQLITTNMKFGNRHLEIGYITKELKSLAKELDIPIILLSQLSRAIKGEKVREPQLDDLKESGEIENDADIVLFIHKPDYYVPGSEDADGVPWRGRGKLIIAKYREGIRNQYVLFHHDSRYKRIYDLPTEDNNNTFNNNNLPF
jgi:replicative DNA helicase